jgi:hypothetical protein
VSVGGVSGDVCEMLKQLSVCVEDVEIQVVQSDFSKWLYDETIVEEEC